MVNKSIFHRFQFAALVILVGAGILFVLQGQNISLKDFFFVNRTVIHIETIGVQVEVARTPEERALGLSGRDNLDNIDGLLIAFDEPDYHGIWMKDMKFPIDVVWIGENNQIVDITKHLTPQSYPRVYEPKVPALYALEVDVLFVETYGIAVGNDVTIPDNILE